MVERAALVREGIESGRGWMLDRLPADAISIEAELPPKYTEVLGWVSDPDVAIHYFPTVVRRDGGDQYWAGLPAKWIDLDAHRWTLTHWRRI